MNSRIYTGEVQHARLEPVHHAFRYPLYLYAFDLDELEQLDRELSLFGYNRLRPVSLHDRDFLVEGPGSIREKFDALLTEAGIGEDIARVELLTAARWFNRVFNPVSFYHAYDARDELRVVVAEVNNTFREKHVYLLHQAEGVDEQGRRHYRADKEFHVSPFYDLSGSYDFYFGELGRTLDIGLDKRDEQGVHFTSSLRGRGRPLTGPNLARTVLKYPLSASLTLPRIMWQAARLHYQRKLPVHTKPLAKSPMTLRMAPPTLKQRLHQKAVFAVMKQIRKGRLDVELPDRSRHVFGTADEQDAIRMHIRSWSFFTKVYQGADIGFGEAWVDGDFSCEDLTGLLALLTRNQGITEERKQLGKVGQRLNRLYHRTRQNTLDCSRRNIQEHYDLSNEFFRAWLDPSMTYSCALYQDREQRLEEAQHNKMHALIEKARIGAGDHVLEIGCGWGSFAIEAVRRTGCRVTGLTLSEKQKEFAEKRIAEEGLSDRIDIQLMDYRNATGTYDRIVSIEMLEAVGDEYFEAYFAACDRLLKPGGWMSLQVITIPDQRYERYRESCDWIQKYIFPGGVLPSVQRMTEAMTRSSDLVIDHMDRMGLHYARTLETWRECFEKNWGRIQPLGFDEAFRRTWHYYLSYCEAGFATDYIDVVQLVLTRPDPASA